MPANLNRPTQNPCNVEQLWLDIPFPLCPMRTKVTQPL